MLRSLPFFLLLLVALLFPILAGWGEEEEEKDPRKLFTAGVTHSLEATEHLEQGNDSLGIAANAKAIESYRKVIALDPTHPVAESALAHALLLAEEYEEAISWYQKAIARDSGVALHYTEMGVAQVNMGKFDEARRSLSRGLQLDSSDAHREFVTRSLARIGLMAFQYAEGYAEQGHAEQALEYRRYSLEVMKTAYGFGRNRALAASIADLAEMIGDSATAEAYRQGAQE